MIPVAPRRAPKGFNAKVLRPGLAWLKKHKIPLHQKLAPGTTLKPLWRRSLRSLHRRYGGVCAYLCVWIEPVTGGATVDHFVAKSKRAGDAYRWSNFRLACSTMNARKRDYDDVLDPFALAPDTFQLDLVTGKISPGSALQGAQLAAARDTIERLGLDDRLNRKNRVRRFEDYLQLRSEATPGACAHEEILRRDAPFLWYEAKRQGLL